MLSRRRSLLIPLMLIGAIAVIVVNTWLAVHALDTMDRNKYWVEHTWQVINQVERIMGSAKDAESGARGYLLTGDKAYLVSYNAGLKDLPLELDHFGALTSDNPSQARSLSQMRAIVAERLSLLQQGVDLRSTGESESLHAMVLSGTGESQMESLRSLAADMQAEEQRLLAERAKEAKSSSVRARMTLLLASGLDLLLILAMLQFFARERELRLKTEETAVSLAEARVEVERNAEEVRQLNVTLEERVRQRTAELELTNRELEAFSYSVSHDLRAPLRTIDGFSLALEEDYKAAVDATGRDYIHRVRTGVQRMGQLIDALLQLSRITRAELVREKVDLSSLAESIAHDLAQDHPERDLGITIDPGMTADADPKLLRVALENLLNNAVKFSSKVERPQIHFGFDQEQQAFFIRDNGAGFDMYYAGKLFNAFNRLHGDRDFKGSGIGLATVARVIQRHHGRIWAHAEVDRGATFFFTVG